MNTKVIKNKSYWVRIYMAGDINKAEETCRSFVECGLCVNISKTNYIYSFGEQDGFVVELIQYPKFPDTEHSILNKATELMELLLVECHQKSCTIMTPEDVYYVERERV